MPKFTLPSFAKGELSPEIFGRVDVSAYQVGLAKANNAIVHTYGGISRRSGLKYVTSVADHSYAPLIKRFEYKSTDTYLLEFGHEYIRVIRNDGNVLEDPLDIEGITNTNPVVVTITGHGYFNTEEIEINDVAGLTELNGRRFVIKNKTADTFELTSQFDGSNIDGTSYGTYTSGGTTERVYYISSPYQQSDLSTLKFTQSADVITITHPNHLPRNLTRTDHDAWTLDNINFLPTIDPPRNLTIASGAGAETRRYIVTAISRDNGEESLAATIDTSNDITNVGISTPCNITITSDYGLVDGDEIEIADTGIDELDGKRFIVDNWDNGAFTLDLLDQDRNPVNGEDFVYSTGGTVTKTFFEMNHYSTGANEDISWDAVQSADRYAVYRQDNGLYIWIGETNTNAFADGNIEGDQGLSPPKYRDPFPEEDDQPGTVGYYEQRQVFGGSTNNPDQSNYSRTGDYNNFSYSSPQKADDSIEVSLPAGQVNEIRHYVTLNDLIVFTSDSEWKISSSGTDKGFGIDTIKQQLQTRWGCSHRPPIVYGNTILYVTNNNSDVRSMGYSLEKDGYTGSNLNILSRHFLRGHTVIDWTSQVSPDSRIYMVRDDGIALTLGFDQEQELVAWTSFTTDGIFEGVESLPRGGTYEEDSIYWVVKRQVNGNTVRYIEVMRDTYFDNVKECFFVDAGLTYDEPITITNISSTNPVVITAPGHGLSNDNVVDLDDIIWDTSYDEDFNEVFVDQLNNGRYTVKNVTTDTFEIQDDNGDVDGTSFVSYNREGSVRLTVQTITKLYHLEGRTIIGLVDGNVVTDLTVTDGTIILPNRISRGHFGLRNICDIVTLPWPASGGQSIGQGIGMWKKLTKVTLKLFKTRGVKLGPSTSQLIEIKLREFEKYNEPTGLLTGEKEVIILPSWNKTGQVYMRQSDPLPFTLLSVTPYVEVGDE